MSDSGTVIFSIFVVDMLRTVFVSMILVLFPAELYAGEVAVEPDSVEAQIVRSARKVDRFLQRRQQRQNTDTTYIYKPQQKWLFRTRSDVIFSLLEFHNDHSASGRDFGMDLKSKPIFRQNLGIGYRGVVLDLGIAIPFKNKDKEFSLNIFTNPAGGEITYGRIGSLGGKTSINEDTYEVVIGTLPVQYVRFSAYYAFNWKKSSLPAAMTQSFIQRRSAGTPLITTSFRALWGSYYTNGDASLSPVFNNREFFYGIGGGYAYNWVPSEHWLIHISATETFGLFGRARFDLSDQTVLFRQRFIPLLTAANASVIYYYKRFYIGAFGKADILFIPTRERTLKEDFYLSQSRFSAHLTIGFRL